MEITTLRTKHARLSPPLPIYACIHTFAQLNEKGQPFHAHILLLLLVCNTQICTLPVLLYSTVQDCASYIYVATVQGSH